MIDNCTFSQKHSALIAHRLFCWTDCGVPQHVRAHLTESRKIKQDIMSFQFPFQFNRRYGLEAMV